jgi:hypothetical protein
MADRMSTAARMDRQRANARLSRIENGHLKRKERALRDAKMVGLIKAGTFPYIPSVMSWASVQLGQRSALLTEAEVKALAEPKADAAKS